MKIKKYQIVGFLLVVSSLLMVLNTQIKGHSTSTDIKKDLYQQEEKSSKVVVTQKNVVIKKRTYRYVEYEKIRPGVIRLRYIVPQDKVLVIPSELDGYKVEELGKDTESDIEGKYVNITRGKKVKKVVIGKGVRTIKDHAFYSMDVSEVILPKSLRYIGDFAFSGDNCTLQKINLDWVEEIGYGAFYDCQNLKKIRLQNEKVVVGPDAFGACSHLKEIKLPKKMKGRLEGSCFAGTGIKEIKWPRIAGRVEKCIESSVFADCRNLKKVEFPKNQKHIYIGHNMFIGCGKLHKLVFPKGTGLVTYQSTPCAENYAKSVTTLEFQDANTSVRGNKYRARNGKWKYDFITVNKIIAPKNSKAARYAKKAICIKKFTKKGLKILKEDDGTENYNPIEDTKATAYRIQIFEKGKVKLLET
ncbi:MAG: leucine-rich repeat domain-containing protein [Lachnospiraceae bacterium]|nr:leucine-rich repeat domain-containing protein [Lachnospiraceae bacterium]